MIEQIDPALITALSSLLAVDRLGLVTDVDGTISHLVDRPEAATVTPANLAALRSLREQLPLVACVSGRAAADIAARVGLQGVVYVGNHGFERWEDGQVTRHPAAVEARPELEKAAAALREIIAGHPAAELEDKEATLTLHYRNVAEPQNFAGIHQQKIEEVVSQLGLRLSSGNHVFEVRPAVTINKGTALREIVKEFDLDGVIFIGDDVTDVDGFQALEYLRQTGRCRTLAIGVAGQETPDLVLETTDFSVAGVTGVESMLAWLASASTASLT